VGKSGEVSHELTRMKISLLSGGVQAEIRENWREFVAAFLSPLTCYLIFSIII
jgi:hypothetical protein